jgi:hypothetical protein
MPAVLTYEARIPTSRSGASTWMLSLILLVGCRAWTNFTQVSWFSEQGTTTWIFSEV